MRVSPTAGRSIVVFAPISTSSSTTTPPACGILWCVPSGVRAKPKPSLPMTAPSCTTTRLPRVTRSRTETRAWRMQSSPIGRAVADRDVRKQDGPGADPCAFADADEGARPRRRAPPIAVDATLARGWMPGAMAGAGANRLGGLREREVRDSPCAAARRPAAAPPPHGLARMTADARVCPTRCRVFRVDEERQIARAGVLDAGDAPDFDARRLPRAGTRAATRSRLSFNRRKYNRTPSDLRLDLRPRPTSIPDPRPPRS